MARAALYGPTSAGAALVTPREPKLQQTLKADASDRKNEESGIHASPSAGCPQALNPDAYAQHRKNTRSAEKPGPMAESTPMSPAE